VGEQAALHRSPGGGSRLSSAPEQMNATPGYPHARLEYSVPRRLQIYAPSAGPGGYVPRWTRSSSHSQPPTSINTVDFPPSIPRAVVAVRRSSGAPNRYIGSVAGRFFVALIT